MFVSHSAVESGGVTRIKRNRPREVRKDVGLLTFVRCRTDVSPLTPNQASSSAIRSLASHSPPALTPKAPSMRPPSPISQEPSSRCSSGSNSSSPPQSDIHQIVKPASTPWTAQTERTTSETQEYNFVGRHHPALQRKATKVAGAMQN